jgi:hypothetical protein
VWQSLRHLERFGETLNPGYFVIRLALWLMVALILIDAVLTALPRREHTP